MVKWQKINYEDKKKNEIPQKRMKSILKNAMPLIE